MPSPFGFAGKRIVMTGAFSGMGRAAAEYLVADGAEVHAIDVRPLEFPVTASYQVDLRDTAAIDQVAARITESVGSFDILLNCAGLPHSSFPADEIFQVNYLALRRLTSALVPCIPAGGCVASITSKSGLNWPEVRPAIEETFPLDDAAAAAWFARRTDLHEGAYSFSKACATLWSITQATPLGEKGVRINCISPGATDTPMM
jgi:NAD(P)-dependent dehydrogenase (short-subunit alcohol dehydrogenase family)